MNVVLYPLDRVEMNEVSISLGMEQAEVDRLIGPGHDRNGARRYYFNTEMAVDYDAGGKVEFIEFLGGVDGRLKPVIYGVSAFDVDAEELTELLRQRGAGQVDDQEGGCSRAFPSISVGLYRELTPAGVAEMEEEMRADGIPTEENPDLERDRRRASHWATIGLGAAGYYDAD